MTVEAIYRTMLEEVVGRLLDEKLKRFDKLLHEPDTTILSDEDAARILGQHVSTLRRKKKNGTIKSILTPRGRMVRRCDLEKIWTETQLNTFT